MPASRVTLVLLLIVSLLGPTTIAQAALRDDKQDTPVAEKTQDEGKKSDEKKADSKKADRKRRAISQDGARKGKESGDKKDHREKSSDKNRDRKKHNGKQNSDDKKSEKRQAAEPQNEKNDAPRKEMKRAAKQAPTQEEEPREEESPKEASKPEQPATKADEPQADKSEELKATKNSNDATPERQQGEPTPATRPLEKGSPAEAPAARQRESKSALAPKPDAQPPSSKPEAKKIDKNKFAVSDLAQVDDDFWLQGEYHGMLRRPDGVLESAGIQVVARGDGKFIGRQLRGGLPGNGWDNAQTIELAGEREGNRLVLRHELGFQVVIENNQATVSNSSGNVLGILMKVQRRSKMIGLQPTGRAIVLFDGNATEHFVNAKVDENGLLQIGTVTKEPVQDFRLHLEFRLPYMPYATGQARSNSGVYIQERYEVQILDSFGLPGVFNGCGSLYRTKPPEVNMCFPPLVWQSYYVYFTAARFDDEGNKISPARISVLHNGILVQDNYLLPNKTGAGKPEGPEPRPIKLQDHGNPVVFRNVWIERPDVAAKPAVVAPESLDDSVELIPAGEPLARP